MKRTNELSRTAKPCPLERRVRYAGQAPAPHSSALCAGGHRARAGIGRVEDKRYLSLIFNPSIIPLPPKGERGIYGGGGVHTHARPHSSALCARLCRVPSLPGVALGRQAIASRMVFGSRAKRLADDIYIKNETPGRAGEYFIYISIRLIDLSQQENVVVLTTI